MQYHGTNGPVQSSYPPFLYPAISACPRFNHLLFVLLIISLELFLNAIREIGSHVPQDYASGDALGGYWAPSTLDPVNRTRSYARTAHYDPIKTRSNLHLLPNNTVTKITFNGNTATGVQVCIHTISKTANMFRRRSLTSDFFPLVRNCTWSSRPVSNSEARSHSRCGCSAYTTTPPAVWNRTEELVKFFWYPCCC